jgi:hypothetical protein
MDRARQLDGVIEGRHETDGASEMLGAVVEQTSGEGAYCRTPNGGTAYTSCDILNEKYILLEHSLHLQCYWF